MIGAFSLRASVVAAPAKQLRDLFSLATRLAAVVPKNTACINGGSALLLPAAHQMYSRIFVFLLFLMETNTRRNDAGKSRHRWRRLSCFSQLSEDRPLFAFSQASLKYNRETSPRKDHPYSQKTFTQKASRPEGLRPAAAGTGEKEFSS